MLLFPLLLLSFSPLSQQLVELASVASVQLTGPSGSNMSRFGLILVKTLQFSIGTFLPIQVDIY